MVKSTYSRFITTSKRPQTSIDNRLSVIILGAMPSHKMRTCGPKGLFKLKSGKLLIEHQIDNIALAAKDADVIITVGFNADKILRQCPTHIRIVENQLYENTNTFEELRLAFNNIVTEKVLVVHGEMFFSADIISGLINGGHSAILVDSQKKMPENEIGVTVVNDRATILAYDIFPKWGYITYFVGKEFRLLKTACSDRDKNKLYMFEGINYVLERGGIIKAMELPNAKLHKIESIKDSV